MLIDNTDSNLITDNTDYSESEKFDENTNFIEKSFDESTITSTSINSRIPILDMLFMFLHVIVFEWVFLIVECCIQIIFLFIYALICGLLSIWFKSSTLRVTAIMNIKECFVMLGVLTTAVIPFSILLAYRQLFHESLIGDWELRPIITVFGHVDSRRLLTLTLGTGKWACNVTTDFESPMSKCMDDLCVFKIEDTARRRYPYVILFEVSQAMRQAVTANSSNSREGNTSISVSATNTNTSRQTIFDRI